jgi:molecular chaperone GrpE
MSSKKEKELKEKLEGCEKEKNEYLKGWQRSKADFINYKREEGERMKEIFKYGKVELLSNLIEILDNFEKAEEETPKDLKENEYFKGFIQIRIQLKNFLGSQGVQEIKTINEKINLNYHEIVGEVEVEDKEPGIIIEEIKKGYFLEDKLLRPAKVKVSK